MLSTTGIEPQPPAYMSPSLIIPARGKAATKRNENAISWDRLPFATAALLTSEDVEAQKATVCIPERSASLLKYGMKMGSRQMKSFSRQVFGCECRQFEQMRISHFSWEIPTITCRHIMQNFGYALWTSEGRKHSALRGVENGFPDGEGFQHDMKGELLLVELS
jgi:hypothetical protein